MKLTVNGKSTVDVKTLLGAAEGDTIVVEWAEQTRKDDAFVYLVNTPNTINTINKFDGVVLHPDPSSVNYSRGTVVSTNNVFVFNDSTYTRNLITYIQ
jgi:hypothetical protein